MFQHQVEEHPFRLKTERQINTFEIKIHIEDNFKFNTTVLNVLMFNIRSGWC